MSQPGMGRLSRKGIGGPQRVRLEPHPTPTGCTAALVLTGRVLSGVTWPCRSLEQDPRAPSDSAASRFTRLCGFFIKHVVKCYKMKP